ncbi:MAG TPA: tetratricopeptide repeat protein [Kofleriaceae bacterium]|nr:tetratricopeptide repeat protein [Kofleriaceae bacterium]
MKLAALLVVVGMASNAAAETRKGAPDKYVKAAGDAFAQAMAAEDKKDFRKATQLYERAFTIAPHAATAYNLALLKARLESWDEAAALYEIYLTLAPSAPDRKQVEAALAAALSATQKIVVKIEDGFDISDAYVLVDGNIFAKPGFVPKRESDHDDPYFEVPLTGGAHVIDVVSPVTYAHLEVNVDFRLAFSIDLHPPARVDGSLVVSSAGPKLWVQKLGYMAGARLDVSGKQSLPLYDDSTYECVPLVADVKKGNNVTFVYVSPVLKTRTENHPERCRKLTFKQLTLAF